MTKIFRRVQTSNCYFSVDGMNIWCRFCSICLLTMSLNNRLDQSKIFESCPTWDANVAWWTFIWSNSVRIRFSSSSLTDQFKGDFIDENMDLLWFSILLAIARGSFHVSHAFLIHIGDYLVPKLTIHSLPSSSTHLNLLNVRHFLN